MEGVAAVEIIQPGEPCRLDLSGDGEQETRLGEGRTEAAAGGHPDSAAGGRGGTGRQGLSTCKCSEILERGRKSESESER